MGSESISAFTELLQDHLRNVLDFQVIGRSDIEAMLGFEKMRDLVGCTNTACMVEIGAALGVDEVLYGSITNLGSYLVISLRRVDQQRLS